MKVQLSRKVLHDHVVGLAKTFSVELRQVDGMHVTQARNESTHHYNRYGTIIGRASNVVTVPTVVDEETYACALHELGHACHPVGQLRQHHMTRFNDATLKLDEEHAAWEWAIGHAMVWTKRMEESKAYALGSYERLAEFQRRYGSSFPQANSIEDLVRLVREAQRQRRPDPRADYGKTQESILDFLKRTKR